MKWVPSPMLQLMKSIDIWDVEVTHCCARQAIEELEKTNKLYVRYSTVLLHQLVSLADGDVVDEVRLRDPVNATLHLVNAHTLMPRKLRFVDGVARIEPPLCLACLSWAGVALEGGRPAEWVIGVLNDSISKNFEEGLYFTEDYEETDSVGYFFFQDGFCATPRNTIPDKLRQILIKKHCSAVTEQPKLHENAH
jgi:hypothetical protein